MDNLKVAFQSGFKTVGPTCLLPQTLSPGLWNPPFSPGDCLRLAKQQKSVHSLSLLFYAVFCWFVVWGFLSEEFPPYLANQLFPGSAKSQQRRAQILILNMAGLFNFPPCACGIRALGENCHSHPQSRGKFVQIFPQWHAKSGKGPLILTLIVEGKWCLPGRTCHACQSCLYHLAVDGTEQSILQEHNSAYPTER